MSKAPMDSIGKSESSSTTSEQTNPNISSAEMTAYWRSLDSKMSGDALSGKLARQPGIDKAKQFESKYSYPLVGYKVCVRAGFILQTATRLLTTKRYDSCISFASGFSLLSYCIASAVSADLPSLKIYDTDLSDIITERTARIGALVKEDPKLAPMMKKLQMQVLDLEEAATQGKSLKQLFPECESPVFIIEGVIYFLSQKCVDWLLKEIAGYENAALIVDYWPVEGIKQSACFKRFVDASSGLFREEVKSFWDSQSHLVLKKLFTHVADDDIKQIENAAAKRIGVAAKFTDINQFFPVRFITAQKLTVTETSAPSSKL